MGIDNDEELKDQQQVPEVQITQQASSKKRWTNMNLLVKELNEIVVQRYVENPLLVEGRKFDIRAFMIVTCMKPYLVLYNHGYVRLSLN